MSVTNNINNSVGKVPGAGKILKKTKQISLMTNIDFRKIIDASSFQIPEESFDRNLFPGGMYSYLEKIFEKSDFLSKTVENNGSYIAALDSSHETVNKETGVVMSRAEKFFRNSLLRYYSTDIENSKVNMIYVQKVGMEKTSKKTVKFPPLFGEITIRMLIFIKDLRESEKNTLFYSLNGNDKILVLKKNTFATVLEPNTSGIEIEISNQKSNGKMELAKGYYIIADIEPSSAVWSKTLTTYTENHPIPPEKMKDEVAKKLSSGQPNNIMELYGNQLKKAMSMFDKDKPSENNNFDDDSDEEFADIDKFDEEDKK